MEYVSNRIPHDYACVFRSDLFVLYLKTKKVSAVEISCRLFVFQMTNDVRRRHTPRERRADVAKSRGEIASTVPAIDEIDRLFTRLMVYDDSFRRLLCPCLSYAIVRGRAQISGTRAELGAAETFATASFHASVCVF